MRFDGSLYFANVSFFEDAMLKAVAKYPDAKYLLAVGDAINQIDASGEEVLHHLVDRLHQNQVTVVFSGLKRQILEVLEASRLIEVIGDHNILLQWTLPWMKFINVWNWTRQVMYVRSNVNLSRSRNLYRASEKRIQQLIVNSK
ncbi:MAG: hypothetical protein BMS9Abin19_0344 [Gammaproteobacteria bacterium]|nr:MAG: hypothetical protein BMS9Abin19_0344 [Gammaproteobacteria bacterium]